MKFTRGDLRPPLIIVTTSTWDPAATDANITLSGANLTATQNTNTAGSSTRGTLGRSSNSNRYFEISTEGTSQATAFGIGLGSSAAPLSADFWSANGIAYRADGVIVRSGIVVKTGLTPYDAAGSKTIQVCTNVFARNFFAKLTTDAFWNGNPVADPTTGAGGIDYSSIGGAIFPMLGMSSIIAPDVGVLNTGASAFVGAVPAGFSAWG